MATLPPEPGSWSLIWYGLTGLGNWVAVYPLLAGEIVLVVSVVRGWLGRSLGLPNLFWHESRATQFFAGAAVSLLFAELLAIGYMIDRGVRWVELLNRVLGEGSFTLPDHHDWGLGLFLLVTGLPLLALLVLPPLGRRKSATFRGVLRWPMVAGMLVGAFLSGLLLVGVFGVLEHLQPAISAIDGAVGVISLGWKTTLLDETLAEQEPQIYRLAVVTLVLIALTYGLLCLLAWTPLKALVSPAVATCELLGLLAAFYVLTALVEPRWQIVVLITAAAWGLFCNILPRYKVRFPNMGAYYLGDSVSLRDRETTLSAPSSSSGPAMVLLNSRDVLKAWRKGREDAGVRRPKLAIVATSGGASRASIWTAVVLDRLEQRLPGFQHDLRLITGASGGMVGAAYYAASFSGPHEGGPGRDGYRTRMIDDLAKDCLTPIARSLLVGDLPMQFLPLAQRRDRGVALEETWKEQYCGILDRPMLALRAGEEAGWRPSLVFSPMTIEDGRRLLISNLDLRFVDENRGSALVDRASKLASDPAEDLYSRSAYEFFKLFPKATDFRIGTAVRMSATFPYVSPAVHLPSLPSLRVVDAGYYDNFGIAAASSWIQEHRDWIRDHTGGLVVIQLRGAVYEEARRRYPAPEQGPSAALRSRVLRGFQEFTGPIQGGLTARNSVMAFRNDEQIKILSDWFRDQAGEGFFTTVAFEFGTHGGEAAMNWYLPRAEVEAIKSSINAIGNEERLRLLEDWWNAPGGPSSQSKKFGKESHTL